MINQNPTHLLPRARYHRGQKVIITKPCRTRVKMSYEVFVPANSILTVLETIFPDEFLEETVIRCRNKEISPYFDFCVPEDSLIPATKLDRLLYV